MAWTFKKSAGKVVLDSAAQTGTVEINIDTASIDLALDRLNEHVASPEMLDVAKFPTATYKATLGGFENGTPTLATGALTLKGRMRADATGTFNRADFGVNYGQQFGSKQEVALRIQVEAVKAN